MRKKRVLIVSTYNTSCGIATFTSFLQAQLAEDNDLDLSIAPLDQDVLKRFPDRFGDKAIREIVERARSFDVVNIQLEWGILGRNARSITKRFEWLLAGCDSIILTVHTPIDYTVPVKKWFNALCRLRIISAMRMITGDFLKVFYEKKKVKIIKKAAKRLGDNFHIVVHTKRERKFFEFLHGLKNIHDHPLSNMRADWFKHLQTDGRNCREALRKRFGTDVRLVGCFGFISPYKGLETAIDAMRLLPETYKLLIYGSIHPEAIQNNMHIDAYLDAILQKIGYAAVGSKTPAVTDIHKQEDAHMIMKNIFFMGVCDDYAFMEAIYGVDVCVFPYLETGQSASGPVSIAIELQKNIFLSGTRSFNELFQYFPDSFERFDIGNYVQLAQMIQRKTENIECDLPYSMETQKYLYKSIIERL